MVYLSQTDINRYVSEMTSEMTSEMISKCWNGPSGLWLLLLSDFNPQFPVGRFYSQAFAFV